MLRSVTVNPRRARKPSPSAWTSESSVSNPDFPAARFAEMIGLRGIRVGNPDKVGAAWDEAFAAGMPCVLEAVTDPSVPPLPPHITLEQARAMMSALRAGDADRGPVVRQSFKDKLAELLPSR